MSSGIHKNDILKYESVVSVLFSSLQIVNFTVLGTLRGERGQAKIKGAGNRVEKGAIEENVGANITAVIAYVVKAKRGEIYSKSLSVPYHYVSIQYISIQYVSTVHIYVKP